MKNYYINQFKTMVLIFIGLVFIFFLVGSISAYDFDNVLSYENNDLKVKVKNAFGLGEELGTAELKSHKSVDEVLKFGYGKEEVVMFYDFKNWGEYKNGLGEIYFVDMNTGKEIEKDYYFVEWVSEQIEVNDYGEVCSLLLNGTNECSNQITGSHLEERFVWKKLENKDIKNVRIGLKTYVGKGDKIDGVWTIAGKKIKKHAVWSASLKTGVLVHYDFEDTGSTLTDSTGNQDGTIVDAITTGVPGALGNAWNFTGGYVNLTGLTSSTGILSFSFWVKTTDMSDPDNFFFDSGTGRIVIISDSSSTTNRIGIYDGSYKNFTITQIYDTWTNYIFISNATGWFLFVDGVQEATTPASAGNDIGGITELSGISQEYFGGMDEVAIWNRSISFAEVTDVYGGGIPPSWDDANDFPVIVLNSPVNNTNSTKNQITFNCTASDDINLMNVSLILDGVVNETNSTDVVNGSFFYFTKNLADGDIYWSCRGADNESGITTAGEFLLNVNTTPNIVYGDGVPVNEYNSTTSSFEVNVTLTETFFKNITFDLYNRLGAINRTVTFTNTSRDKEWTNLPDGDYSYNVTTATTTNQFNQTATRNISIDINAPDVSVFYPTERIGYHLINTNLSINWSANDTNLDSCILEFEGVNRTLTCSDNQTQINITNIINKSFILYVNDTFGHITITSKTWNYTIFENSQTFNDVVFEGDTETFTENITLEESSTITIASLFYNGTSYPGTFSESENYSILTIDFTILSVSTDTNITFIWNVQLSDEQSINLTSHNQTITEISLDDCSVNTIVLYNYTIVDEGNQTLIWGNQTAPSDRNITVEFNLNLLDVRRTKYIANFTKKYSNVNPFAVCLNKNLNSSTYSVDSIVKYEALTYSVEYYNIVDSTITNSTLPINITLYDLATEDSTEFKISFKGEDFVFVENALIYIDRQYISENNSFKTVELPKTDSDGQTIGHFVRNDIIYNIRVTKNGEVLGNFENIIAFCQDYTIGNCQIVLEATPSNAVMFNYDKELGITFQSVPTYNNNTHAISFSFSTYDGTPKTVLMEVTRSDIFGNRSICNHTLTSASGTLSCTIDPNIDDTSLITSVYVNNQLAVLGNVELEASDYGNLGYVLWFFLTFFFIFLFGNSKTEVLIGLVVSLTGAITLGITRGNIIGIGSAGIWMIVIVILGIYKINKENPQ